MDCRRVTVVFTIFENLSFCLSNGRNKGLYVETEQSFVIRYRYAAASAALACGQLREINKQTYLASYYLGPRYLLYLRGKLITERRPWSQRSE